MVVLAWLRSPPRPGQPVSLRGAGRLAIVALCLALGTASAWADVDLTALAVYESQTVTKLELTGHKVTKEYVITRELETRAGDAFRVATVVADFQRLDNLSIFAEIDVLAEPDAEGVHVTFRFKEMPAFIPFVGFAYTEENGFSIGPGVSSLNLKGRDMSLSARAYFGDAKQQWARFSWPWIGGDHVSFDFYGARLTRPDTLNGFQETSYEFSPEVGKYFKQHGRLKGKFSLLRMESDVDGKTLNPDNGDILPRLGASVGWDTRDSWFMPRSGWKNELEIWRTGFGGDAEFWTMNLDLRRYVPVGKRQRLLVSGLATLQSGTVGLDIPEYMTFHLGGANSIRGYKLADLGPSLFGKSQVLGTAEYSWNLVALRRWDIFKFAFRLGLDMAVFSDAGLAWSTSDELRWNRGRGGLGAGVRLLVPGSEMVRFDFAWSEQGGFQFHFASGTKPTAQRNRVR